MWDWEQGRMSYFQYDDIRTIARFVLNNDFRNTPSATVRAKTGLAFPPNHYTPWRNYARAYKLCLLVSLAGTDAIPTDVAAVLATDGATTCDEYLHFLAEATTYPSPALNNWNHTSEMRWPLAFSLKYILANVALGIGNIISISEIIGAYITSGFDGTESVHQFVGLMNKQEDYRNAVRAIRNRSQYRQARESLKFLCQLSYLHTYRNDIFVTLDSNDAADVFEDVEPLQGNPLADGDSEIRRLARFFRDGSTRDIFDYPNTVISDVLISGFIEGSRVKRSHTIIERNSRLRDLFFTISPTTTCDACGIDTHVKYPWTERVLDMHHVLPLASGTRVDSKAGTLLEDLRAVCPTCHRSVHRYYDIYLTERGRADFLNKEDALQVYGEARASIVQD